MGAKQGGQPKATVFLRVLLTAGAEVAAVDQLLRHGQHTIAVQAASAQIGEDLGAPIRQALGQAQHPVELFLGAVGQPLPVVEVLPTARRIGADGLDVAIGVAADPDFPRRRNDQ